MPVAAVVFDLGGVVTDSPLRAIARYEIDHGLPPNAINRAVLAAGDGGAWSRLERGELTVENFCGPFEAECRAAGLAVDAARLMAAIDSVTVARPLMIRAIGRVRAAGIKTAALTNNWHGRVPDLTSSLRGYFEVFVESRATGMRKPDARMYELVCRLLGMAPPQVVYLDDIGANLKPARALGMRTIKVEDPEAALRELGALLGLDLLS